MTWAIFILTFLPLIQEEPSLESSADAVIERFIESKGGKQNLLKIKNYVIKGVVIDGNGELIGNFEIYQAAGRHLSIQRFPDGSTRSHGTDGKRVWQIDVDGTPTLLRDQEARDYLRHYTTLHESLEWKNHFGSIKHAGQKTVDGEAVHHLIFIADDNRQINRYFSVRSGLLIREEQVTGDKNDVLLVSKISNYQKSDNILVSRLRHNQMDNGIELRYQINETQSNLADIEERFELPEKVLRLILKNNK